MSTRTPSYRLHQPRRLAVVTLTDAVTKRRRSFYLGPYDTPESRERYHRIVAQWEANGRRLTGLAETAPELGESSVSVVEVLLAFARYAKRYYRRTDGTMSNEINAYRQALRVVKTLYGTLPAIEFGPCALELVRDEMIRLGWARTHIHKQISRTRSVFKWAASREQIPSSVYQNLQTLSGLRAGQTEAHESEPVRPVAEDHVCAIQPYVGRQVWTLTQLQLLTGARAGELVRMRPVDLDTTTEIWTYGPGQHKTRHHGHLRTIYLGPRAQELVRPFLAGRAIEAFLFSPVEAEVERRAEQRRNRVTPVQPSQRARSEQARLRRGGRRPGHRYTTDSYRRAIQRACRRAGVPEWSPHQLRHNAATHLRREVGVEMERLILGHRSPAVTEVYAEIDQQKAIDAMARVG